MKQWRSFSSLCVLLATCWPPVFFAAAEKVLVSVQSASQRDMDLLTAGLDAHAHSGASRVTLGAIEATMSRVVDVDDPYLRTVPTALPTLQLLHDVAFDSDAQHWTFVYKTMQRDASQSLNSFRRVLYFSKTGTGAPVSGDTRNPCLVAGVDDTACLADVATDYVVATGQTPSADQDYVEQDGSCANVFPGCSITASLEDTDLSAVQTLTVVVPHQVVRDTLATRSEVTSPLYGVQTQFTLGVGMLFVTEGNNMVIFDSFDILENSHEQLAISKRNSYAVARHVSFWTQLAHEDHHVRVATIEYLLDPGQDLLQIDAALNGRRVNATDCALMQARIDALSDPACISPIPLCQPSTYTSGSGTARQTWATFVLPLPPWHSSSTFEVNTLLTTNDTVTATRILSTLNFETQMTPVPSCKPAKPVAFSPTEYVVAELFRGHALAAEVIQGPFTVSNSTAPSITEALLTVVVRPKDTDAAVAYFATYTDEKIGLDDLYMSHALDQTVLPDPVANTITGLTGGHTQLTVDPALLQACPMEDAAVYSDAALECVTTHDWAYASDTQAAAARPVSAHVNPSCPDCHFFVREAGVDVAGDKRWLQDNIFGSSDPGIVDAFVAQVAELAPAATRPHARTYWVSPLYAWPNRAPMGLEDRTVVSLAWSISKAGVQTRRLLGLPPVLSKHFLPPVAVTRRRHDPRLRVLKKKLA